MPQKQIRVIRRKIAKNGNKLRKSIINRNIRKRLQNTDFTIISSNCIGARIYQELGIAYNTPFVGMFIFAPCFIKLLSNLEFYLKSDISFIDKSKYENIVVPLWGNIGRRYPIGLLPDGIEIHFQHFTNEQGARTKWNQRVKRMNMSNLFITFTDRDLCDEVLLRQFDKMQFRNKVCFTAKEYPSVKSSFWITEYQNQPYVGDMYTEFDILKRNFNYIEWLNGGKETNISASYLTHQI